MTNAKPVSVRTVLLVGVTSAIVACGANKPEPTAASTTPPAETAKNEPDASAAPAASPPATAAATPAADAGAAPEPAKPPPAVSISEPKDECTPVGIDFEKRARPKLKECYAEGKKKNPNLEGTVKIKVTVDVKGKIKSTTIIEKTLPAPVADCMLKVIKTTPFPEVDKCWDASLTIPITFPTPR